MDKRYLLVVPVAAFAILGAVGYVAGMPKPATMVSEQPLTAAVADAASVTAMQPAASTVDTAAVPVDQEWLLRTGAATGIPVRALQAYAVAAQLTERANPGCNLGWNTLAAIGEIESGHGTHGGATLNQDGTTTQQILGPVLDGTSTAAIADTDRGALDGDTRWDRAVGPLQFIPDSWARHGVDADGDGVADPNDIDDAALTAAVYLCASGDLSTPDGWTAAVHSYNHLDSYVVRVRERATAYAQQAEQ